MRRRGLVRHDDELSAPPDHAGDEPCPLELGEALRLADVVDPTGRVGRLRGEHDRRGDVLHIPARRPPLRYALREDDDRTLIVHALEHGPEAVQGIAGPVNHRQPKHGRRLRVVAEDRALDRDLVVLVVEPPEELLQHLDLRRWIRLQLRAKG